jgi:hypothetical protein
MGQPVTVNHRAERKIRANEGRHYQTIKFGLVVMITVSTQRLLLLNLKPAITPAPVHGNQIPFTPVN